MWLVTLRVLAWFHYLCFSDVACDTPSFGMVSLDVLLWQWLRCRCRSELGIPGRLCEHCGLDELMVSCCMRCHSHAQHSLFTASYLERRRLDRAKIWSDKSSKSRVQHCSVVMEHHPWCLLQVQWEVRLFYLDAVGGTVGDTITAVEAAKRANANMLRRCYSTAC
jgi:hypothetical protein